jgi:dGTPase
MLGKIKKEDIPKEIVEVLGIHNRDIINTIIMDIINNSLGKNYIKLSDKVYKAIVTLKEFNTNNIYLKSMSIEEQKKVTEMFYTMFNYYKDKLNNNIESSINREFINYKDESYRTNNTNERIIIDFIAGMTDNYFIKKYNNIVKEKEYEMYTYSKK